MKKLFVYSLNNSGGGDWLSTENWKALERAGWKLGQYGHFVFDEKGKYLFDEEGFPKIEGKIDAPRYAYKFFECAKDAIKDFERVAEQNYKDRGCDCCGRPHYISQVP